MKEADGRKKEAEAVSSEVASPDRVEEPEPQVVAEPLERMRGVIVAEKDEDVWVAPVAKQAVAESRVALEVDENEVALVSRVRYGAGRGGFSLARPRPYNGPGGLF